MSIEERTLSVMIKTPRMDRPKIIKKGENDVHYIKPTEKGAKIYREDGRFKLYPEKYVLKYQGGWQPKR